MRVTESNELCSIYAGLVEMGVLGFSDVVWGDSPFG